MSSSASVSSLEIFDCSDLRRSVALQWSQGTFREQIRFIWKQWLLTPVSITTTFERTKEERKETSHANDSNENVNGPQMDVFLNAKILSVIQELKNGLSPQPWHRTIDLVCFDFPIFLNQNNGEEKNATKEKASSTTKTKTKTSTSNLDDDHHKNAFEKEQTRILFEHLQQLEKYITMFIESRENSSEQIQRLLEASPLLGMKEHPETQKYLTGIILPFRSFVVAQICSALISDDEEDEDDKQMSTTNDSRRNKKDGGDAMIKKGKRVPGREDGNDQQSSANKLKLKSTMHNGHHAKDIPDALFVESLVLERDMPSLEAHVQFCQDHSICCRFAQYCLFHLNWEKSVEKRRQTMMKLASSHMKSTTNGDEAEEEEEEKFYLQKLLPLAENGLAHAQYDVGIFFLRQSSELKLEIGSWISHPAAGKKKQESKKEGASEDDAFLSLMDKCKESEANGLQWLGRSARLGHSQAMILLAKYYWQQYLIGNKDAEKKKKKQITEEGEDSRKKILDVETARRVEELLWKNRNASRPKKQKQKAHDQERGDDQDNNNERQEIDVKMMYHWLDVLCHHYSQSIDGIVEQQSPSSPSSLPLVYWDEGTPSDVSEGQRLLFLLDSELEQQREKKRQMGKFIFIRIGNKLGYFWCLNILIVLAGLLLWLYSNSSGETGSRGISSPLPIREPTHISKHLHPDATV